MMWSLPRSFFPFHATHHAQEPSVVVIAPMLPDPALLWQEPVWIAWEHAMLEKQQYGAWRTGQWEGCGPNHFYSGNASVRRAHLMAVGGFDEQFPRQEDVELAVRLERQCRVHFVYAPDAPGTHRPQRRFASWLAVPLAYGQLDVVRARRGDIPWEVVRSGYHPRNQATRLFGPPGSGRAFFQSSSSGRAAFRRPRRPIVCAGPGRRLPLSA